MIPDGPAKIRWLPGGLSFQWASYPDEARGVFDAAEGGSAIIAKTDGWIASSCQFPTTHATSRTRRMWCPGNERDKDELVVCPPGDLTPAIVTELLYQINDRYWEKTISRKIAELLGLS